MKGERERDKKEEREGDRKESEKNAFFAPVVNYFNQQSC
jgi:hypothetical protein